jgi:hypothetical protein
MSNGISWSLFPLKFPLSYCHVMQFFKIIRSVLLAPDLPIFGNEAEISNATHLSRPTEIRTIVNA